MIRTASLTDIPAILTIGRGVVEASPVLKGDGVVDAVAAKALRNAINHGLHEVFVAEVNGAVVGFFIAVQDQLWYSGKKYATDLAFCVAPGFENQAVWLLKRFLRWCVQKKVPTARLVISAGFEKAKRTGEMYQRLGFTQADGVYYKEFDQ